ncbi:MAG: hypothetical protein ABIH18_06345 [Candidatus Omnitrophota bacterium]
MKSIVIYYSCTSTAKLTAELMVSFLKEHGEADILELKGGREIREFMGLKDHYSQHEEDISQEINLDLSGYDLICFGISVWILETKNVMHNYLEQCFGLEDKRGILYIVPSGIGEQECFGHVEKILSKKGIRSYKNFSVPRDISKDKIKLDKFIRETLQFYV